VAYAARADYSEINLIGLTSVGFVTIEKIWLDLVGFSNLNAQLLPHLAGTFAPGAVYLVLRRRAASHTALLGAAVMALTTIHVEYSPRVKQYTIEALLVLLLLALTFRWRTEPNRKNTGILVAAMVVACMFSFILATACLTPLVVMVLTARDDRTRRLVTGGVSAMVPVLGLWYFVMVRQTDTAQYLSYANEALATSDRFWLVATRMDLTAHWPVAQEILAHDLGLDLVDSSESEGAVLQLWKRPDEAAK